MDEMVLLLVIFLWIDNSYSDNWIQRGTCANIVINTSDQEHIAYNLYSAYSKTKIDKHAN